MKRTARSCAKARYIPCIPRDFRLIQNNMHGKDSSPSTNCQLFFLRWQPASIHNLYIIAQDEPLGTFFTVNLFGV